MDGEVLISLLPNIHKCRQIFQSIAMLDAILIPEWANRYYSFNSKWDANEMMASMRDGSGEHYFALFNQHGLIIKGFEHQSADEDAHQRSGELNRNIFDKVPYEFISFHKEPAFIIEDTTFCIWNLKSEGIWCSSMEYGLDELYLLKILVEGAEGYVRWAKEYNEKEIAISIIKDIFDFKPLNKDILRTLNNEVSIQDMLEDIVEINYPYEN